ncbi:hypothetical protein GCM10010470_23980 [Saccharopolyspora taberi]|uniref:Uncharacterized protein n=1 Tax=Saccharopolyspora taberi TaxID=60895 RepID=A0ABN3VBY6_9PSEU
MIYLPALISDAWRTDPVTVAEAVCPVIDDAAGPAIGPGIADALGDDNEHQADTITTALTALLSSQQAPAFGQLRTGPRTTVPARRSTLTPAGAPARITNPHTKEPRKDHPGGRRRSTPTARPHFAPVGTDPPKILPKIGGGPARAITARSTPERQTAR